MLPLVFGSIAFDLGGIVAISISVVICCAIPLTAGMAKGHVALGIICALITLPVTALLTCVAGLPMAFTLALIISLIPPPVKPLLTQSEIEDEMRKMRGF